MTIHQRAARALLSFAVVVLTVLPVMSARAQEPSDVRLQLLTQTPFTTIKESTLEITILATNDGDTAIGDLSVGLTIGQAIRSRTDYLTSLSEGPLALSSVPAFANSFPKKDTLEPGKERFFTIDMDMAAVGDISTIDSLVYPAQVDLRSEGTQVGVLNTPVVHIVRPPEAPVRLAWWAELTAPVAFNPQGQLADPAFEASVAPDRSLGAEVEALRRLAEDPERDTAIDVVIEPALIDQLVRMADGYERADGTTVAKGEGGALNAATLLASLRSITASIKVQVSALPFSAPLIPALLSSGLASDLDRQRAVGEEILRDVLDVTPVAEVARPPSGALDEPAVEALALRGVSTILADPDTVVRTPQPNSFAPLPTATLAHLTLDPTQLILPDPDASAMLADPTMLADPVRTAQSVFGELATIWREQPVPGPQPDGSETVRGVAVALPSGLPAGLWGPLIRRLADAPFLRAMRAQELATSVNPPGQPASLAVPSQARFSTLYAEGIRAERRNVSAYRSMEVDDATGADQLDRSLLYAEAGQYADAGQLAGRVWIDHVNDVTEERFGQVQPRGPQVFTLTSEQGTIPLRMGDPGPTPVRVQIQLTSAWFSFPDGDTQLVTLDRPDQIVNFRVQASAGGQAHSIQMKVRSPSGHVLNDPQTLIVRSATVNRIALIITIAAALVLVGMWSRRLFRRPSS